MNVSDKLKKNRLQLTTQYKLALTRELYRKSFFDFVKDASSNVLKPGVSWEWNWHHEILSKELQEQMERINRNEPRDHHLLVNCPPSVTKSTIFSICLCCWVWACVNPNFIFIQLSHSDELAIEFSGLAKDLIESNWFRELFPNISIRQDSTAKSNFRLNGYSGQRISLSLLGGITGHHGTCIILDDYIDAKNVSPIKLENAQKIYREAITTRLENPKTGLIALIGQRVNDSDLYNFLLSKNQDHTYKHICLPMELSDDVRPVELKQYYTNGVLWDARFPFESFASLTDSSQVWATQFQQSPKTQQGNIVKEDWLEKIDSAPVTDYHIFIDSALTGSKKNDPSAILIAGVKDNIVYVRHSGQYWLEFPDLIRKILELAEQFHIKKIYIEPKASGLSIAQQLRKETMLNVVELKAPQESKTSRLNSTTPKLESKRVKLVRGGWNENFLYELTTFPNAKHDDQLDCLIYAVDTLFKENNKISWYM